jgi:hypothetical protein
MHPSHDFQEEVACLQEARPASNTFHRSETVATVHLAACYMRRWACGKGVKGTQISLQRCIWSTKCSVFGKESTLLPRPAVLVLTLAEAPRSGFPCKSSSCHLSWGQRNGVDHGVGSVRSSKFHAMLSTPREGYRLCPSLQPSRGRQLQRLVAHADDRLRLQESREAAPLDFVTALAPRII